MSLLLVIFSLFLACSTDEVANDEKEIGNLTITTSSPIITDWIKNIDGDNNNDISNLIPYDSDAHHYQFTPKDFTKISESDVFFLIGDGYESSSLIKFIEENNINHVELLSYVNPMAFEEDGHDDHEGHGHDDHADHGDEDKHDDHADHGDEDKHDDHADHGDEDKHDDHADHGDEDKHDDHADHGDEDKHDDHAGHEGHDHGEFDPHFWFDIDRVILATEKISQTMVALDSENEKSYVDNQSAYAKKLADFATQTKEKIDNSMISNVPFITMHESLGYLIAKYSLSAAGSVYAYNLEDLEVTSSKYIEMLDVINDSKANFLIVEDNVAKKMADSMVDDTGITLITGMTVENMKSADQSYIDWIENNVSILVEGLSAK